MTSNSIAGRLAQLRHCAPWRWPAFLGGWLNRRHNDYVPCAMPGSARLLKVPLKEFYECYAFFCEQPEGCQELGFFLDQLKPGDVFYDIGGFRGAYSAAATLKQPSATIHIFEPLRPNAEAIQRIFQLNNFTSIQLSRLAVSDGTTISGSVNEQDAMLRLGDRQATQETEFPSISLDDYVAGGNPAPTLIKIDVDGFELHVLRGGKNTFRQHRPRVWLEIHPGYLSAQGSSAETVIQWLRETGYTLHNFDDFNRPSAAVSYHIWCE